MSNTEKREYPKFLFKIEDVDEEKKSRFNSRNFGTYENREGKIVYLRNADGRAIESGFTTSRLELFFDVSKLSDSQIVKFLLDSPENISNGGTGFSLVDVKKVSDEKDNDLVKELQLENRIMNSEFPKLRAVSAALGLNYNDTKIGLQTNIIRRIRTEQEVNNKMVPGYISVQEILDSDKTMISLEIKQMLEKRIITIDSSGIYVHGQHSLGLNEDQVVVYFNRNQPVHALLKQELRRALVASGELDEKDKDLLVEDLD